MQITKESMFLPREILGLWLRLVRSSADCKSQEHGQRVSSSRSGSRGIVLLATLLQADRLGKAGGEATCAFPYVPILEATLV